MVSHSVPQRSTAERTTDALRRRSHDAMQGATSAIRDRRLPGGRTATIVAATAVALAATALIVDMQARRAERRHPPKGRFVEVDGVRLHHIEAGDGDPVVLLHGNGSMLDDPLLSIFGALAEQHRVIAFDRPGFGWSERPHNREWTPEAQATLIRNALRSLGIKRPVLYGHSFGAPVAVSYALMHPQDTRGIVAASGYYYPHFRADSIVAWSATVPVVGPILRNTLLPVEGAAFGSLAVKALFDPAPVPEAYSVFPASLTLRPSQIRAAGEDGRTLRAWAKRVCRRYREIKVPVVIVAGREDRIVDPYAHSGRLHDELPGSRMHLWIDTGHMVHHTRAAEVIDAIDEVFGMADTWTADNGARRLGTAPAATDASESELETSPPVGDAEVGGEARRRAENVAGPAPV